MKPNLTPVTTNVYLIPERLREIDPEYFVVRNHEKQTFEIHHRGQPHTTYCLTVPYDELDARTLTLVQKTSVSHLDTLVAEIDRHNQKLEATEISEESIEKTKEVVSYLNHHESREWVGEDAFSTRFL